MAIISATYKKAKPNPEYHTTYPIGTVPSLLTEEIEVSVLSFVNTVDPRTGHQCCCAVVIMPDGKFQTVNVNDLYINLEEKK